MTHSKPEAQITTIRDRQQQLIRQRKQRFQQGIWRTFVILGLTVGLGWAVCQPEWHIRQSDQITLSGNEQIDRQTLEHLMVLQFPTSLIRFKPQTLISQLKASAHLSHVIVNRKLFPPRVNVVVQERPPIAMTECQGCTLVLNRPTKALTLGPANVWLIDRRGVVLPADSYPNLKKAHQLPKLTIEGYLKLASSSTSQSTLPQTDSPTKQVAIDQQKQRQWQQMYAVMETSPVQIKRLNWYNPKQLTLHTKLGKIRIGPFSEQFSRQLQVLDEMRTLPKSLDPQQIVSIDIEDPENPAIELRNQPPARP